MKNQTKFNLKHVIYQIEFKYFTIIVVQQGDKSNELQLFWKSNRMKHFKPLMDGEEWITFQPRYLLLAICAANDAAVDMIFYKEEAKNEKEKAR